MATYAVTVANIGPDLDGATSGLFYKLWEHMFRKLKSGNPFKSTYVDSPFETIEAADTGTMDFDAVTAPEQTAWNDMAEELLSKMAKHKNKKK